MRILDDVVERDEAGDGELAHAGPSCRLLARDGRHGVTQAIKLRPRAADLLLVSVIPSSARAGDSALEALVDAAAGILAADSLEGTLGRIAHHLATLVHFDDLSVYEIDDGGDCSSPCSPSATGSTRSWRSTIPLRSGVTGLGRPQPPHAQRPERRARSRCARSSRARTRSPRRSSRVPLIAHDRVLGSLNVYRTGADVAVHRRGGRARRALRDDGRARVRLGPPARAAARAGQHDGLTGLLNHRACHERLREALAGADGGPVSVVVIDLDHFKLINDRYGHAEGDRALAPPPPRLRAVVRESDAVGRLGGEEFVLILPGVDADAARTPPSARAPRSPSVHVRGRPLACSAGRRGHPDDASDARRPAR